MKKQQYLNVVDSTDIHICIAARIFSVPPEQVTAEQRQIGEETAYAAAFGIGPRALAGMLGSPRDEACSMLERAIQTLDEHLRAADQRRMHNAALQNTPAMRVKAVMRELDFWCRDLMERECSPSAADASALLSALVSKGAPNLYELANGALDERSES